MTMKELKETVNKEDENDYLLVEASNFVRALSVPDAAFDDISIRE